MSFKLNPLTGQLNYYEKGNTVTPFTTQTEDFTQDLTINTKIDHIDLISNAGSTIKIGTTEGGEEILFLTALSNGQRETLRVDKAFSSGTTLYYTITGSIDIYVITDKNYPST